MPAESLQLDRDSLRREIGRFLGFSRTPSNWTSTQTQDVNDIIKAALRRFYWHAVDPTGRIHRWSFLRPVMSVTVSSQQDVWPMPDEFGGLESPITIADENIFSYRVRLVNEGVIRNMKGTEGRTFTGQPLYAALRPVRSSPALPQRWEIMVFPVPNRAYTLQFRASLHQSTLDTDNPYPLGGQEHSQTIRAACLAEAEKVLNDRTSARTSEWEAVYQQLLWSSIAFDRQVNAVDSVSTFIDTDPTWEDDEFGWDFWRTRSTRYVPFGGS